MKRDTLSKIIVAFILVWIAIFVWRKIDVTFIHPPAPPAPAEPRPAP